MNDVDLMMNTLKIKTYRCYCAIYYEDILYDGKIYKKLELCCNERVVERRRLFREPTEKEMLNFIRDYIKNKKVKKKAMIEKERLEYLIKNNIPLWFIEDDQIKETHQTKYWKIAENKIVWYADKSLYKTLENLFETKEEAEWYLEFGNITRTETLNLPSWKEFNKKYKKKYSPVIAFNGKNPQCFYEMFFKKDNSKKGCVLIYDCDCKEYVYSNRLTKENYTDACRLCKKLFLGELED